MEFKITIKKQPWWKWIIAALVLVFEVIVLQAALTSPWELEMRAAIMNWIVFILVGAIFYAFWTRVAVPSEE